MAAGDTGTDGGVAAARAAPASGQVGSARHSQASGQGSRSVARGAAAAAGVTGVTYAAPC